MNFDRTSKQIAERIDIDYYQRVHPMRRWRRWISWSCLGIAGVLAFLPLAFGKKTVYQAGPLSTPHAMLAEDCSACHTGQWQTAMRLISLEESHRSVTDASCKHCHQVAQHATNEQPEMVAQCSECHREHRGNQSIIRSADSFCVSCHGNLKTSDGSAPGCESCVLSWQSHPEFAVISNKQKDPTQIYFNHKVHMAAGGIRTPDGTVKKLECADCHQVDATGRYMKPVSYETACASCHANALAFDHRLFPDKNAPHGNQGQLTAWLRNEYTEYLIRHPDADASNKPKSGGRAMPHKMDLRKLTDSDWHWVQQHTENAERMLLTGAGGCKYCHHVDVTDKGAQIVPPNPPLVWMSAARFNHKSHDTVKCEECHAGVAESTQTSDVLMSSIQVCKKCHGAGGTRQARSDCVECHTYHDAKHGKGPVQAGIGPHTRPLAVSAAEQSKLQALTNWTLATPAVPKAPSAD